MDKEYWHRKWQSREIGFNQLQPNKLMQRYFSSLKLTPGCRVFVPLCGQSIDMLWLAGQGYQVVGVELSQIACSAFFKENKIQVKITEINDFTLYSSGEITIFSGDFFKLNQAVLDKIDAVYDRAALIALPMDVRKSYSEYLIELMTPATAMFLITTVYNQNEMQGPPFSVDENEIKALYSAHFDIQQLYSKQAEMPAHLQAKGLLQATEQVYSLVRQNKSHNRLSRQS
ncbi:MAG: thiopurine S-methyltransferase [Legionellales bacterium]|nr:thiopurine S-methyltransferase [Legionellales bacterium]